jgi:ankyrin repeat protein
MTGQQLWEAARDGDAAKVSTLLSTQGAQSFINYQDAQGFTPLFVAALKGHAAVTEQLIAARCNVNLQVKDGHTELYGCTPLHAATEIVLEAALYVAAGKGHETVTRQLIAARCNVDLQKKDGSTPLYTIPGTPESPR